MTKHPDFHPLNSSVVQGYHYVPATSTLTLKLSNGTVWQYQDVPMERAETLKGSISPGRYFTDQIRGQYNGKKL